jgi:hypothetical protein
MMRAMRWHLKSVPHFVREGRGIALLKGLIDIVDLNTLCPKVLDVLGESSHTSDVWNNVGKCSTVFIITIVGVIYELIAKKQV